MLRHVTATMVSSCRYTSLSEPRLSQELARLARAKSVADTDCVSFQPCLLPSAANQDRYVVEDWPLPAGTWSFRAVFDGNCCILCPVRLAAHWMSLGHAGHETVDFACERLPAMLRNNLVACLRQPNIDLVSAVPDVLRQSIAAFDELIAADLLRLFPDPNALSHLSDSELRSIINDKGRNSAAIYRCMSGSTVLLSLLDPARKHLWVATLGDSQAGAYQCMVSSAPEA